MPNHVTVRYPQLGAAKPTPITGRASDAIRSISICGRTNTTFCVEAEDVDDGIRFTDEWARADGIAVPGEIGRVAAAEAVQVA
jgi:hypothetical protein